MKNKCILLLLTAFFLFASVFPTRAATPYSGKPSQVITVYNPQTRKQENISAASVTTLPDGSKLIVSKPSAALNGKAGGQITANKPYSFVNSKNELEWRVVLTGSFTYDGTNATCTSASSVTTVYQGNWSESVNNTFPSGNTAVAQVTVVRKVLFIVVETQNAFFNITCSAAGQVS